MDSQACKCGTTVNAECSATQPLCTKAKENSTHYECYCSVGGVKGDGTMQGSCALFDRCNSDGTCTGMLKESHFYIHK